MPWISLKSWVHSVVWIKGDDVAEEIARYAQSHNVTKIVMGKPRRFGLFPTLARKIMVRTRDIDIFLFAGKSEQPIPKKKIGMISPLNYVISAACCYSWFFIRFSF